MDRSVFCDSSRLIENLVVQKVPYVEKRHLNAIIFSGKPAQVVHYYEMTHGSMWHVLVSESEFTCKTKRCKKINWDTQSNSKGSPVTLLILKWLHATKTVDVMNKGTVATINPFVIPSFYSRSKWRGDLMIVEE